MVEVVYSLDFKTNILNIISLVLRRCVLHTFFLSSTSDTSCAELSRLIVSITTFSVFYVIDYVAPSSLL